LLGVAGGERGFVAVGQLRFRHWGRAD
jgi:hypothetical protein